jgi:hypothetical protein
LPFLSFLAKIYRGLEREGWCGYFFAILFTEDNSTVDAC